MKYCPKCGRQLVDEAVICVSCGCAQTGSGSKFKNDSAGFGWGVLGFFFPLVGLILYLLWKGDVPKRAKSAGIGALVGAIIGFLVTVIVLVSYGVFLSMLIGNAFMHW